MFRFSSAADENFHSGSARRAKSTVFWTPRRLDRESNFTSYKLVLYDCNHIA